MQLHMKPGALGAIDERKRIYPDAPFFSPGGRDFLRSLTRSTRKRLQLTLRLIEPADEGYWQACRVRAPDAGRMMWAMGKLQWQSTKLLKLLEAVAVQVRTFALSFSVPHPCNTLHVVCAPAFPFPGTVHTFQLILALLFSPQQLHAMLCLI